MIGGTTKERNGKTALPVGLSHKNIDHLKNVEILLFDGNTEASMLDHLQRTGIEVRTVKDLQKAV